MFILHDVCPADTVQHLLCARPPGEWSRQREKVVNRKMAKSAVNAFKEASRLQCKSINYPKRRHLVEMGSEDAPEKSVFLLPAT